MLRMNRPMATPTPAVHHSLFSVMEAGEAEEHNVVILEGSGGEMDVEATALDSRATVGTGTKPENTEEGIVIEIGTSKDTMIKFTNS